MDTFSLKLTEVLGFHLKIIYWLLIVITLTLVGVKGAQEYKNILGGL
jgi:uncharacterized iron-regulated membrane protein